MLYRNSIICSLVDKLDFILAITFSIFFLWILFKIWNILTEVFGTDKAIWIFCGLSALLVIASYI